MSKKNWKKFKEFKKQSNNDIKICENKPVVSMDDLIKISIEVWRIRKRINKNGNQFSEQLLKGIDFSYEKIQGVTSSHNIELKDIQGEKYFEDMNGIEIVSADINEDLTNQITIQEMIEPIVMLDGKLYKKGKVIIGNK